MCNLRFVVVAGIAFVVPMSWGDFHTGFEPPLYEPGFVQGQHGWMGEAEVVTAPHPVIQKQSLRQGPSALRTIEPAVSVGTVEWSWYFDGSTYVPGGPGQMFVTNIFALSRGRTGDDHLWYDDGWGWKDLGFDMPWDRWVSFRLIVNPTTNQGTLYMDNTPIASLALKHGNNLSALLVGGSGASPNNQVYLDEIHIVVPEPVTLATLVAGLTLLRRRQ